MPRRVTVFGIASILVSSFTLSAIAQSANISVAEPPPCQSKTGVPGILFRGQFHTVTAPEGTVSIMISEALERHQVYGAISNGSIEIFAGSRHGDEVLVFAYPLAEPDERTEIAFHDHLGNMLHACTLNVVDFDGSGQHPAGSGLGYCDFAREADISYLQVGQERVFDLPVKYRDGATSPPDILQHRPEFGARQVALRALAPGYATFVWHSEDTGNGTLMGFCPFQVRYKG